MLHVYVWVYHVMRSWYWLFAALFCAAAVRFWQLCLLRVAFGAFATDRVIVEVIGSSTMTQLW